MRLRRGMRVTDLTVSHLALTIAPIVPGARNLALGAAHEFAHVTRADVAGVTWDVVLDASGNGHMEHLVGPALDGNLERTRDDLVETYLAGAVMETLLHPPGYSTLAGQGSFGDLRCPWRLLHHDFPEDDEKLAKISSLWLRTKNFLIANWHPVTNGAGHLLAQPVDHRGRRRLLPGQARRILAGIEADMRGLFHRTLSGIEVP